jgi:hypothetical protein
LARWLLVLLSLWLYLVCASLARDAGFRNGLGIYLVTLILVFVSTLVHEGGHAIMARLMGWRILQFAVIPFEFDTVRNRLRFAKVPRDSDISGYVKVAIPGSSRPVQRLLLALGGPLAEGLLAMSLFGLMILSGPPIRENVVVGSTPAMVQVGRLPDDASVKLELSDVMPKIARSEAAFQRARLISGLAEMIAILASGSVVINLLPLGGSDGSAALVELRALYRRSRFARGRT